jgi:hypothetical protein
MQKKEIRPLNLAKEVDVYGYHFSWKEHVVTLVLSCLGICGIGVLYRLHTAYLILLLLAVAVMLPYLIADSYKRMYEQKRFADVTSYMEQMLYSFQKTGKTVGAWKETVLLFEDGQMRNAIEAAIAHVEDGRPESEQGILREAMERIEQNYGCTKLSTVHELLLDTEEQGGDVEDAVLLLLEDIENWKKRGYRLHAEKKKYHEDNVVSIVISALLCAVALYVLLRMQELFPSASTSIFDLTVIQISSTVFLLFLLLVYAKSSRSMTDDWLGNEGMEDSDYIMKSYDKVMRYEEWDGQGSVAHKLFRGGYRIAKQDVTEELYRVLPEWFMKLLLLLQNNNVQVALVRSSDERTSPLLKRELSMLSERMEEYPEQLSTYTSFFRRFDVPEIASCMKMLHAVSESGTGNVAVQMTHLLARVHQMQDRADELQNESMAFRMKLMFSYSVVAATGKLLFDMTVGMVVMMQMIGGIGGML